MEWTDESIARLRALWQEGLSTAEIGRRMGITKNAVVGKAHRLDLAARPSPIRKTDPQPGDAQAHAQAQPKRPLAEKPRVVDAPVEKRDVPPSPVASPPVVSEAASPRSVDRADPPVQVAKPETPPLAVEPIVPAQSEAPPGGSELPDNVRLLRPDMPNPAVAPAAPRDAAEPARVEPVRPAMRVAEPREPRRRGLTCCWPLGEPGTKGFHFCGADPTPGKPYCADHAALAYVKLRDRRDSVA